MKIEILSKRIWMIIIIVSLVTNVLLAQPPKPPAGKVWVINPEMSDEFDAQSPSPDKWRVFDKQKSWDRTSAFDKRVHEAVKDPQSDNYYLAMNPMWYYEDERFTNSNTGRTYLFSGGGMDTKVLQTYGYFEVRIKPSDFPMGSGVFMNSRQATSSDCNTKYSTELDIIENMGYTGPFNEHGNGSFNNYMHVNSHIKPSSDVSGSCKGLPYESTNSDVDGSILAEPLGFNTVGMWWVDKDSARFYNNGTYFGTIQPTREMYLPMPMILTMETYGWGSDEKNATNPKPLEWMFEDDFRTKEQRAVMYDWVRSWKLVDVDAALFNTTTDNVMAHNTSMTVNPGSDIPATIIYSASTNRTVVASLFSPENVLIEEKVFNVDQNVHSINAVFKLAADIPVANGYKIVYEIKDGTTVLKSDNSTVNIEAKQLEKQVWGDLLPTSIVPGTTAHSFQVKYETDVESTIVMEMHPASGSSVGYKQVNVSAGSTIATLDVTTNPLTAGTNFYYKVYMFPKGSNWQDPNLVSVDPQVYFNVEEAIVPAIEITNYPASFMNNAEDIEIEFSYATTANGTLDLMLVDKDNNVLEAHQREERIGSRTLTRTVKINSALGGGNDHKIITVFTPYNNEFAAVSDTVYNVNIEAKNLSTVEINSSSKEWTIYPVPTANELTISTTKQTAISNISLIDVWGKTVHINNFETKNNSTTLNISHLKTGVYLLRINSGNKTYTTQIVKK